jgi:hypothetical protein
MSWWNGTYHDGIRMISNSLKADRSHLANAPLTKRQRTELAARIAFQEKELKKLRAQKRRAIKDREKSP